MASTVGALPDRYAQPTLIASGGMGRIFLATDTDLRRDVVVKVLAERYAQDESIRARFRREALAAARLSANPNIVTIFDVARVRRAADDRDGVPQRGVARGARTGPWWLPARTGVPVDGAGGGCAGRRARAGVVHRDFKPANLLLDSRDEVHVGDFGIASAVGPRRQHRDGHDPRHRGLPLAGAGASASARRPRATVTASQWSRSSCWPASGRSQTHSTRPRPRATLRRLSLRFTTVKAELPAGLDRVFQARSRRPPPIATPRLPSSSPSCGGGTRGRGNHGLADRPPPLRRRRSRRSGRAPGDESGRRRWPAAAASNRGVDTTPPRETGFPVHNQQTA